MIAALEFTWAAAAGRIPAGAVLTRRDLAEHPLIVMPEGSGLTRAFDAWTVEHGLQMNRAISCNSLMAIVGLTVADMGISFLPAGYVQPWLDSGKLVALKSDPPLPTLRYDFLSRKDDGRSLIQIMRQYVLRAADFSSRAATAFVDRAMQSPKE